MTENIFMCPICKKKFETSEEIIVHREQHRIHAQPLSSDAYLKFIFSQDENSTICAWCKKEFKTYVNKSRHERYKCKKITSIICEICRVPIRSILMQEHLNNENSHRNINKCSHCSEWVRETQKNRHILIECSGMDASDEKMSIVFSAIREEMIELYDLKDNLKNSCYDQMTDDDRSY